MKEGRKNETHSLSGLVRASLGVFGTTSAFPSTSPGNSGGMEGRGVSCSCRRVDGVCNLRERDILSRPFKGEEACMDKIHFAPV